MVHFTGTRFKPIENTLFMDEDLADFHFVFVTANGEDRVPVHKLILANASNVFKAMFFGSIQETREVKIVDASKAAFIEFLRYIYANQINLSVDVIADVMNLANKYNVAECLEFCKQFLERHLPIGEDLLGLELSMLFDCHELKAVFEQRIGNQLDVVIKSDRFMNCSYNALKSVLEMKYLLCDAKELFVACMKWAANACEKNGLDLSVANQRKQLADCLYLIPFRAMAPKQISKYVNYYDGLFNVEELKEIITMTTLDGPVALKKFKFKSDSAAQWSDGNCTWSCYHRNEYLDEQYWIKQLEIIPIGSEKQNRLLGGIKILEIRHNKHRTRDKLSSATLSGIMSVVIATRDNYADTKMIYQQRIELLCSAHGSFSKQYFQLIEPVYLEKNRSYEIRFAFESGWADETFHAVVPYPNSNNNKVIIHSLQFKYLN